MISDNLAPLFDKGQPGVRFRQGTVLSWNPDTGENTVDLAGATLTDVPVLNTSEATALKAGHVVGMLGQGSAWFIIGRVTPPNSEDFAGASVAFAREHVSAVGFALTTTDVELLSVELDVPAWADEALVQMTSAIGITNPDSSGHYLLFTPYIEGIGGNGMAFGVAPTGDVSHNDQVGTSVSHSRLVTNPGPTIRLSIEGSGSTAVTAHSFNLVTIDAFAVFRSTV